MDEPMTIQGMRSIGSEPLPGLGRDAAALHPAFAGASS
jgi:hypothetical protein